MIIKDNESISSVNISSSFSSESDQEHCEYAIDGDLLVVRNLLGSLVKEKTFFIQDVSSMDILFLIIDGGSCTNVANSRVV